MIPKDPIEERDRAREEFVWTLVSLFAIVAAASIAF